MLPEREAISVQEFPLLWPMITVEQSGPAWSHLTPPPDDWRSAMIAAKGARFWQEACDSTDSRTESIWQLVNMRCNERLQSLLTRADEVNKPIGFGMASEQTPLTHALWVGNIEAAKYMLSIGGDVAQDAFNLETAVDR